MSKTIKLNKSEMPLVGFGTYLIPNEDAEKVITDAFEAGYRQIDTAQAYFNEEGIGNAIQKALTKGTFSRNELFITTKLWPGNEAWGDTPKNYNESISAFEESLSKLKIDYIDLYLIHAPFANKNRIDQWKALINLQETGKIMDIGVCNYNINHLEEIKNNRLPLPTINQVELHPWTQKPELMKYMKENSIHAMAYSSLVPISTWRHKPGQGSAKTDEMKREGESKESPFKKLAEKYNVSEARLLLRWGVQQNIPVIPKSTNPERMKQNLDLFSFEISPEDMNLLNKQDKGSGVAWETGDPSNFEK